MSRFALIVLILLWSSSLLLHPVSSQEEETTEADQGVTEGYTESGGDGEATPDPSQGQSEDPSGQSDEPPAPTDDPGGQSEEPPGPTDDPSSGQSEEPPAPTDDPGGQSEEPPAPTDDPSSGQSDEPPAPTDDPSSGQSEEPPPPTDDPSSGHTDEPPPPTEDPGGGISEDPPVREVTDPPTEPPWEDPGDSGGNDDEFSKLVLDTKLLKGSRYDIDRYRRGQIITVYHSVEVTDIIKVDVESQAVSMEFHFQQRWQNSGLDLPKGLFKPNDPPSTFVTAPADILKSVWSPRSYIPASRNTQIAAFTVQQARVYIFRNKTIIYNAQVSVNLGCQFDFQWFPKDTQACSLRFESYAKTEKTVRYLWEENFQAPLTLAEGITLFQYALETPIRVSNGSATRWGKGDRFPYVEVNFVFHRKLGNSFLQVFIPTVLVVILSWFSFWLGLDAIPARVTLLITCLLTIVTMHSMNKSGIPPVSYVKMMDIWLVTCMTFIFLAIFEFVVVKYLHWRERKGEKPSTPGGDPNSNTSKNADTLLSLILQLRKKLGETGVKNLQASNIHPYLEFYRNSAPDYNTTNVNRNHESSTAGSAQPSSEYRVALVVHDSELEDLRVMRQTNSNFKVMKMYGGQSYDDENQTGFQKMQPNWSQDPLWVIIDWVSRIAFPLCFLIFNLVYWPVLLS